MGIGDWSDEFRMCRLVEAMRVLPASAFGLYAEADE